MPSRISHNTHNCKKVTNLIFSMSKINTSKLRDFNKEVIIKKISIAAREIAITNDKMRFLQRMISKLLMNQDLHFPSVYGTVDEKAQATTYFIADYIDTIDIDHASWIYRGVTLLTDL